MRAQVLAEIDTCAPRRSGQACSARAVEPDLDRSDAGAGRQLDLVRPRDEADE